ncbi:MAG: biotin--[acetyl-CoA-carboxylase] ligase [Cyanobacteriota bacterium]|nr:biotin--[acetyl-CoA-carboxylase] ligase [Cyanobacteriota bacterium]
MAGPAVRARPPWRLRECRVCASTERELDHWLAQGSFQASPRLDHPRAVVARRQRFGHGQRGRVWQSPPGGVWLSAALPWGAMASQAAAPGLAVAVGLLRQLEDLGLDVRLKWPNDLLLRGRDGQWRKLAGLLSGLRLRGPLVRWARVGLGLNGCNPVPPGATNLVGVLGRSRARPRLLLPRVFAALEWAMAGAQDGERVRREAEARLWLPASRVMVEGGGARIAGLTAQGCLVLVAADGRRRLLHRSWSESSGGPYIGSDFRLEADGVQSP